MSIVPLTTPLPVHLLGVFEHEALAPLAWLFAGIAVLLSGARHRRYPIEEETFLAGAA